MEAASHRMEFGGMLSCVWKILLPHQGWLYETQRGVIHSGCFYGSTTQLRLVHIGCTTQHHRRGETLCNLVCDMNGMLLYLTGNGRIWFLTQVMLWLMEDDLSDSVGDRWKYCWCILDAPLSTMEEERHCVTWYAICLGCWYISHVIGESDSINEWCYWWNSRAYQN